jgi:hypothetical protein
MTSEATRTIDDRRDVICRVLNATIVAAPEAAGATLVAIVEGQGDWQRSDSISCDIESWMKIARSTCHFPRFHAVTNSKGQVGVSQTAAKKSQMVENMGTLLKPECAGIAFHENFRSPNPAMDELAVLGLLRKQLLAFERRQSVVPAASLGRRSLATWYTGKKGKSNDDLAMVLLMATLEPRVFLEGIH